MKQVFTSCLFGVLISLGACSQKGLNTRQVNLQDFKGFEKVHRLNVGESIMVDHQGTIVSFLKVSNDSRCPKGGQCIVVGKVSTVFKLISKADEKEFELELNPDEYEARKYVGRDIIISVEEVNPYPTIGKDVNPEDYQVGIIILKKT